ncbi:class I SAM-dependent methyltransferase [Candidatus Magnetaquicoccus inordinatus]|uniref:class I SAM-dependent methyltransferase n=1 Tax=Candidatus Magnetaquicoccus inordinatus TaxID=2496818 RepID=UPI00102CBB6F|nr:methyltransferase domain-containing protein [Candidatus Magnetaquicoccus inordinatus]
MASAAHDHHPKHRFDPAKAANLLDPQRRLLDDPLALLRQMGIGPGMQVADLGCGVGFFTEALLQAVGAEGKIFAVELQEAMLTILKQRFPAQANLQLQQADLLDSKLEPASCDVAFIAFTLHEVPALAALQEVKRILRPDGRLLVVDWGAQAPCPEREAGRKAGPPEEERLLPESLRQILREQGWQELAYGERLQGCHYWLSARMLPFS